MQRRLRAATLGLTGALVVGVAMTAAPTWVGASQPGITFSSYQLGVGTNGESCPNSTKPCVNHTGEPAIRADSAGNIYASSENGLGGGTEAWKSSDGGKHFVTLLSPNQGSQTNTTGVAPGGGDTDLATAPVANAFGFHNVYVASLSLANVDVSTSTDGGYQWSLNPLSATISGDDREWIAADGASKVCISYHDVSTYNIDVNCSADAGATFTQLGDAIDTAHAYNIDNNSTGNLAIDPNNHLVYQTFSGINQSDLVGCQTGTCNYHVVYMAVSSDGGKTFTDYPIYNNPDTTVSYGHQFVNVSVDSAGNVYSVFSDNHNLYYSFSTTHGQTWSAPVRVNAAPSNTAIMPWSVAGDAGKLDVVWYGSSYYSAGTTPDSYPSSATWNVYFAQNLNAATAGSKFTQLAASPVNHTGGVCESGVTCTGNRDLYDDFGVTASPTTGLATIVYTDDQYDASQPTTCAQSQNSTSSCIHTEIATQNTGSTIYAVAAAPKK